jgi:D-sedoheptulose 7-phosphate isomerase
VPQKPGSETVTPTSLLPVFQEAARNLQSLCVPEYTTQVEKAIQVLYDAFKAGNKLLVFGNGGSSADALHICGELVGRFAKERAGLPALALSANPAVVTAWSNDYSFETVFARQVEALGRRGDVAWGISTSGNSPNIIAALKAARAMGLRTVGLTSAQGNKMTPLCDVLMAAPVASTPRIQEAHVVTYHVICARVEDLLFPS